MFDYFEGPGREGVVVDLLHFFVFVLVVVVIVVAVVVVVGLIVFCEGRDGEGGKCGGGWC